MTAPKHVPRRFEGLRINNACSDWWEVSAWAPTGSDRSIAAAFAGLIEDTTEIRNGYMYVPQTPGLGRKIDWAEIENRSVLTI